jgi:hypothetical protein
MYSGHGRGHDHSRTSAPTGAKRIGRGRGVAGVTGQSRDVRLLDRAAVSAALEPGLKAGERVERWKSHMKTSRMRRQSLSEVQTEESQEEQYRSGHLLPRLHLQTAQYQIEEELRPRRSGPFLFHLTER